MRKREPLKAVVVTANPEFSLLSERRLLNTQNITVITPDVTEASEYIDAMPDTFRAWYRRHKRQGDSVPERGAA
jgi:hypothetical protein